MRSPRVRAVLLLLLFFHLTRAKIGPLETPSPCSDLLQHLGCICIETSHNSSLTFKTVSCRGMHFTSADFINHIPSETESIIIEESDLDHVSSSDFFLAPSSPTYSSVKYIRLVNNRNSHQTFNLQSLLCFFPELEELHIVNSALLDNHMVLNGSCIPPNLRILNLSLNIAQRLPLETLDALLDHPHVTVNLTGNPFSCDCNFVPTYYWLLNHTNSLVNPDTYTCRDGYPESLAGRRVYEIEADEFRCFDDPILVPPPPLSNVVSDETMSGIYSVVIVLGVMASIVALFAVFLNFPFLLPCIDEDRPLIFKRNAAGSKKLLLSRRQYSSLPSVNSETPA